MGGRINPRKHQPTGRAPRRDGVNMSGRRTRTLIIKYSQRGSPARRVRGAVLVRPAATPAINFLLFCRRAVFSSPTERSEPGRNRKPEKHHWTD